MKVENNNNGEWDGFTKTLLASLGSATAVAVALTGFFAYRLSVASYELSVKESAQKDASDEADLLSKSLECSFSYKGADQCVALYTGRYKDGRYAEVAKQAAATSKADVKCVAPKASANATLPPPNVYQSGIGNQSNSGSGRNSQHLEIRR